MPVLRSLIWTILIGSRESMAAPKSCDLKVLVKEQRSPSHCHLPEVTDIGVSPQVARQSTQRAPSSHPPCKADLSGPVHRRHRGAGTLSMPPGWPSQYAPSWDRAQVGLCPPQMPTLLSKYGLQTSCFSLWDIPELMQSPLDASGE